MSKKRLTAYALLVINTLCWGPAFIVVKPALEVITPTRYLLYRFILASILSLPIIIYYWRKAKKPLQTFGIVTLLELFGTTLGLWVLYSGLALTSAIEGSLIGTTGPIFIVLTGIVLLREREEKREWGGLALSFLGALLIALVPVLSGMKSSSTATNPLLGNGLIILYNLMIGFYFIYAKKQYHALPKLFVSSLSYIVGAVSFLFLSLWELRTTSISALIHTIHLDFTHGSVWITTIYMAIFSSIVGLTAYIKAQDNIEASEAALFNYLQPLVYLPLGYFLLKESVSPWALAGLGLVILGVLIAEKRSYRTRKKRVESAKKIKI